MNLSYFFSDLVGTEVVAEKRSAEDEPNFAPLTPTAKVKPIHGKRSQESEIIFSSGETPLLQLSKATPE